MRGLAALFILVAHGLYLAGVWSTVWYRGLFVHNLGLAIFFVVSGFVIYRPFVASRVLGARSPGIGAYVRRRFLRIIPPYWLALTALAVYPGLAGVFTGDWWVYYGLLQLFPIYDPGTACAQVLVGCGIPTAVTLPGELTFYIAVPLFGALIVGVRRLRLVAKHWLRTELLLLALFAGISVVGRAWAVTTVPFRPYLFYAVTGMFLWSSLGMAMAAVSVALDERPDQLRFGDRLRHAPAWMCWIAGGALFATLAIAYPDPALHDPNGNPGFGDWSGLEVTVEYLALGAAAVLFMLPAVFGEGSFIRRRIMANPILSWLGVISYGLYLYHLPIELKLREIGINGVLPSHPHLILIPASLAVTVICAAASYYAFERPILRFKEPRRRRGARAGESGPGSAVGGPATRPRVVSTTGVRPSR